MRDPGEGAVEFAREYSKGLSRDHARRVFVELLSNPPSDPKIKKCAYCGYPFRDKTKNNSAMVCGPTCKTGIKTKQRRVQRARGNIKTTKQPQYYYWLEYPFWISEKAMLSKAWSYERPYAPEKLQMISDARDRDQRMGGKKKVVRKVQF